MFHKIIADLEMLKLSENSQAAVQFYKKNCTEPEKSIVTYNPYRKDMWDVKKEILDILGTTDVVDYHIDVDGSWE